MITYSSELFKYSNGYGYPDQIYIAAYNAEADEYSYFIHSMHYSNAKLYKMPGLLLSKMTGENVFGSLVNKYVIL